MGPEESETTIVRQVAYIFDPSDDEADAEAAAAASPSRRRKHAGSVGNGGGGSNSKRRKQTTPKKKTTAAADNALAAFPTLLQGRETPEAVARRSRLYATLWSRLDARIQRVLQRSNDATLGALLDFVSAAYAGGAGSMTTTATAAATPAMSSWTSIKLPAAFVVLGPAATTDVLLFRQLASSLADAERSHNRHHQRACIRRMVRLRASECPNLRAALKTIVQEATTVTSAVDDDVVGRDGRKYLAYDLEAVASAIPPSSDASTPPSRVVVAFEDSEAFDGALLADLISFLHSWLDRIPFVLLFGVATSIDLFQGRLPKQAAHRLAAAQFDVAPSSAVLDKLLRCAVAAADVPLRLGPALVRSLAERQDEQVTGVSVFVNSIKYAYMCYFYANPLSVLLQEGDESDNAAESFLDKEDYIAAIEELPSVRRHIEALVAAGRTDEAKRLLGVDGPSTLRQAVADQLCYQRHWTRRVARALHIATASGVFAGQSFTELYIAMMEDSAGRQRRRQQQQRGGSGSKEQQDLFVFDQDVSLAATMTSTIRRMPSPELIGLARRLAAAVQAGDEELALPPVAGDDGVSMSADANVYDARWAALRTILLDTADKVEALQQKLADQYSESKHARRRAAAGGNNSINGGGGGVPQLRSKYTAAQSKAVRTTVVAQKVQLSRDSAALTDEDQTYTEYVDTVAAAVASVFDISTDVDVVDGAVDGAGAASLWLQEIWLYNARTPYRDVFIPRPGEVVERALMHPHDYLNCDCCDDGASCERAGGDIRPKLPPTAILYQLYQDAGPLVNVADLWEAFLGVVNIGGDNDKDNNKDNDDDDEAAAEDKERRHLVAFYQGLSEMKTLGYIKPTRRKVDHVAKIKWL